MAINLRTSFISLGILVLMFYVSGSECKPIKDSFDSITRLSDSGSQGYTQYFRKALMDASHVLDNVLQKGKMRLMDLPFDNFGEWVN